MPRLRSASLFWTFTVAFLLVLVATAVLQAVVVVAVVRPLTLRALDREAEVLVLETARRLAAVDGSDRDIHHEIMTVMSEPDRHASPLVLTFVDEKGVRVSPRGRFGNPRRSGLGPGALGDGAEMRILARRPVVTANGRHGEVQAMTAVRRFPFPLPGGRAHILLFLPASVLIAGIAGAVLFRMLTRRIQALEALVGRVAHGDFGARVAEGPADEIGRLGAGLNRMTERLAASQEELAANERQRRQLLADISHELATPLTSIRGFAETLENPDVPLSPVERAEYMRTILEEAKRMDLLIGDLFELARLESRAIELDREPLDWAELCRNTVKRYEGRFREAGLDLSWQDPGIEVPVVADGRRLEQVLENLLTNALRHVPAGASATVSLDPGSDDRPARLTVADTGPGVPPEHLPHLFERFYQADPSRSAGGTGLGLAIVREIVLRHGGVVRAEPSSPRGLSLTVELPRPG